MDIQICGGYANELNPLVATERSWYWVQTVVVTDLTATFYQLLLKPLL